MFSIWYAHPLEKTINLGLDLQGGMHLVLGVDSEKAVESTVSRNLGDIKELLVQKNIQAGGLLKMETRLLSRQKARKTKIMSGRLLALNILL